MKLPQILAATGLLVASFAVQAHDDHAQRIVSAGANVTEILLALEAEPQLVAVDSTSVLPRDSSIARLGYHRQLSSEGILAMQPDLLIGSDEMGPDTTLQQLGQAGLSIEKLNSEASTEGLLKRIAKAAEILDKPQQGKALQAKVEQQLADLAKHRASHAHSLNGLFFLSHDGRKLVAGGDQTSIDVVMELAGVTNLAAEHISSYKQLSSEAVLSMAPELLIFSSRSLKQLGGIEGVLAAYPVLAQTPAGKTGAIFEIDGHALVGGVGLSSLNEAQRLADWTQQQHASLAAE